MSETINSSNIKSPPELSLKLTVKDENVIKYLISYESPQREDKALEALKVGVIAILSASPSLDTKIVDEKFNQIEKNLQEYSEAFKKSLADELEKYFEKEKGDVPATISSVLGEKGTLSVLLKEYFNAESGKVSLLLQRELGPGSAFAKTLDPNNKESVISKIEQAVNNKLLETTDGLKNQFSLDKDDSGMSRVKKLFEEKVEEIKTANNSFFSELRVHLGMQETQAEEAEKGTQKGRDFETILYEKVAVLGQQLQDSTENVTGLIGEIPRCKVGDYVITLGDTSGAPGRRVVVEAKKEQNYKLRDAVEELKQAKDNRKSDCGIFVFAKGYEPVEMGDFKIDGNDFLCTVDEAMIDHSQSTIFLEAAYKIARIYIITQTRKEKKGDVDLAIVKENIVKMLKQTELMSELLTKAKTIQTSGEYIEKTAKTIKEELESLIGSTLNLLK
ncbi:MAG: hypothetical protein KKC11_03745 [Candidatus Omnitrophica bacterium]|nr:hypothetical protein [Candidatus Omnitrophota bacterium]MBU1810479.1 hypothetical protein [Candidatus Omnitrophota bacterium]